MHHVKVISKLDLRNIYLWISEVDEWKMAFKNILEHFEYLVAVGLTITHTVIQALVNNVRI